MIKQAKKTSVLYDIQSDHFGEKWDRKNRVMEAEDRRKKKSEQKHIKVDGQRLKGLDTCEVLVCSVLTFGMDHINNLKVKYLRVFLHHHFGSENMKGSPNKVVTFRGS